MQAIELLSACQACSKYFTDFDFQQLITLAKELTILHFREREVVLCQGEPATFFGVVLKGALVPVVGDAKMGAARGVGEVIGEMALFSGGTRNVTVEAVSQDHLNDVLSNTGRIFPSQIRDFWLSSGSNDSFGIKELIREFLTGGKYGNVAIAISK